MDSPGSRRRVAGVLVAAGLGGLCFAPVFGLRALAGPVLAVCLAGFLIVEATRRSSSLAAWRPVLVIFAGLLAIVETMLLPTTLFGIPSAATFRALGSGLWSWQRTLESTWPARPEPDLALFVPLLVLLAGLLGVEVLSRFGGLPAMLPSLAVIGLSQAYEPVGGTAAYLLALAYAGTVAAVLAPPLRAAAAAGRRPARDLSPLLGVAGLAVAAVFGGLLVAGLDPAGRPPYTLQRAQAAQLPAPRVMSPLDEVARRLAEPDVPVFRYRAGEPVDRWRLVALDDFDGTNWTTGRPFLRFGAELAPSRAVQTQVSPHSAEVDIRSLPGPWLPSQPQPSAVGGAGEIFVEPDSGTLVAADDRPERYTLSWSAPQVTGEALLAAAVDRNVPVGDVGDAPAQLVALAATAVDGKRATFQTALALERFLAERCELASTGTQLPAGHGWPQLRRFLIDEKRGTSEQFAAAYVALARLNGIPARLVVGFRAPPVADLDGWLTVHNRDVLVWPEVAVDGIGWWPLDPAGLADPARPVSGQQDGATDRARAELPPPEEIGDPAVPEEDAAPQDDRGLDGPALPASQVMWLLVLPPAGWLTGVPFARWLRARRRRRRPGSDSVAGAWAEARDRLRAHGVPVTSGMTVRDLAVAAAGVFDRADDALTMAGLDRLAGAVDAALWSPAPASEQVVGHAWAGVGDVIRGLRARPWSSRVRAALDLRGLLSR